MGCALGLRAWRLGQFSWETSYAPVVPTQCGLQFVTRGAADVAGDDCVNISFCPTCSSSHSVPKKHTEACINYKLVGLLFQA